MDINIENQTKEYFGFRGYKKLIASAVETAADVEQVPSDMEVNVLIVDGETIRGINFETRGIDSETDVLSFPFFEFDSPGDINAFGGHYPDEILGDIVLCADKVISQAEEFGHSVKRELAYLVVHSMLHLTGYDHMTPEDEEIMTAEAEKIMGILNILR